MAFTVPAYWVSKGPEPVISIFIADLAADFHPEHAGYLIHSPVFSARERRLEISERIYYTIRVR